jgi:hypothetical protein
MKLREQNTIQLLRAIVHALKLLKTLSTETPIKAMEYQMESNVTTAKSLTVFTSTVIAANSINDATEKMVTARLKNPVRQYTVNVPADAWQAIAQAPEQYRELLNASLIKAAEGIIRKWVNEYQSVPTEIPAIRLTAEAIIAEATDGNSNNLSKDELTAAWKESATYKLLTGKQAYRDNRAYREAFGRYEELLLKLAGRNTVYKPEELDTILAKLDESDLTTEMGAYIIRRIDAIKNKPVKMTDVDMSLLDSVN